MTVVTPEMIMLFRKGCTIRFCLKSWVKLFRPHAGQRRELVAWVSKAARSIQSRGRANPRPMAAKTTLASRLPYRTRRRLAVRTPTPLAGMACTMGRAVTPPVPCWLGTVDAWRALVSSIVLNLSSRTELYLGPQQSYVDQGGHRADGNEQDGYRRAVAKLIVGECLLVNVEGQGLGGISRTTLCQRVDKGKIRKICKRYKNKIGDNGRIHDRQDDVEQSLPVARPVELRRFFNLV